jgi:hypothetical protein
MDHDPIFHRRSYSCPPYGSCRLHGVVCLQAAMVRCEYLRANWDSSHNVGSPLFDPCGWMFICGVGTKAPRLVVLPQLISHRQPDVCELERRHRGNCFGAISKIEWIRPEQVGSVGAEFYNCRSRRCCSFPFDALADANSHDLSNPGPTQTAPPFALATSARKFDSSRRTFTRVLPSPARSACRFQTADDVSAVQNLIHVFAPPAKRRVFPIEKHPFAGMIRA